MQTSHLIPTRAAPVLSNGFSHADPGLHLDAPSALALRAAGPPVRWPRSGLFALGFVACTVLGLCDAGEEYVSAGFQSVPMTWASALALGLGLWYTWGLLGMLVFALARRYPLGQRRWRRRLALHLAAAVAVAALKITLDYPLIMLFYCPEGLRLPFGRFLAMAFADQFVPYLVVYWAVLLVAHALDFYGKYRERELRAAQLESGLTRARLDLLKSQLRPHFLFNTLNAVSSLIHTDAEAADRVVARLGDLLRLSLEDFGLQEAPLARELEVVRSYLAIEQARLGPRLSVRLDVARGPRRRWRPRSCCNRWWRTRFATAWPRAAAPAASRCGRGASATGCTWRCATTAPAFRPNPAGGWGCPTRGRDCSTCTARNSGSRCATTPAAAAWPGSRCRSVRRPPFPLSPRGEA